MNRPIVWKLEKPFNAYTIDELWPQFRKFLIDTGYAEDNDSLHVWVSMIPEDNRFGVDGWVENRADYVYGKTTLCKDYVTLIWTSIETQIKMRAEAGLSST